MKVTGKAHIYTYGTSPYCPTPSTAHFPRKEMTLDEAVTALRAELAAEAADNDILAVHLEILDDPLLAEAVQDALADGKSPVEAVNDACLSLCSMLEALDDELLKARADDVRDVCSRLRMKIEGGSRDTDFPKGCILVCRELFPSDLKSVEPGSILGILCQKGSSTGHAAIIARSKGIPIQFGADIDRIAEGDTVSVEDRLTSGKSGKNTGETSVADLVREAGRKLYANAGSLEDIRRAMEAGADGIGLFRTEFLYLDTAKAPDFEFQKNIYRQSMLLCQGKVLTIRTMDIGGDKIVPWLPMAREDNPFLGLRGVRLSLKHSELLETQLNAIAAAATEVPECKVKVMFPMVCNAEEVSKARSLLADRDAGLEFGAMVETPAAALCIESLCRECSFFSIGSNDLTQYVMAADRGNDAVAYLYAGLSEPVKFLIGKIVNDAHSHGAEVGICGEAASDPSVTSFLLDAGLDSLSINRL